HLTLLIRFITPLAAIDLFFVAQPVAVGGRVVPRHPYHRVIRGGLTFFCQFVVSKTAVFSHRHRFGAIAKVRPISCLRGNFPSSALASLDGPPMMNSSGPGITTIVWP